MEIHQVIEAWNAQSDEHQLPSQTEPLSTYTQTSLVFAARYASDRQTGAAFAVVKALLENWGRLSPHVKEQIQRETKNEATCNIEDWRIIWDR